MIQFQVFVYILSNAFQGWTPTIAQHLNMDALKNNTMLSSLSIVSDLALFLCFILQIYVTTRKSVQNLYFFLHPIFLIQYRIQYRIDNFFVCI